ncbi:MAG: DUF362 domain-containing protein [Candidatus Omnitrophota bacterium]
MKRKEIVLIKETRKKEFVKKVMGAISPYITLKSGDKVAIKINLSGPREIYANTNYETVESLIFYLKEHFGVTDISVIEGSDGAYYSSKTTWDIFYKFKYKEVELNGAKLVNLDDLPHEETLVISTLSGEREIHYTQFEADYTISVVPPKTHNIFPVCLSTMNILGYVKPEDRVFMFGTNNSELKKINSFKNDKFLQLLEKGGKNFAKLLSAVNPSLSLIDGLFGMEGKGPIKGSPVFHGFAAASEDVVLVDALTTYIMGFDVDHIPYLSYAHKAGIGYNRWQNIIGTDPIQLKFPYRPHPLFPKQKLWADAYHPKPSKPETPAPKEGVPVNTTNETPPTENAKRIPNFIRRDRFKKEKN